MHTPERDRKSTRLNSSHTVIYTLSLHDALPILVHLHEPPKTEVLTYQAGDAMERSAFLMVFDAHTGERSEEHTSELQSHRDLHSFPTRRSSDLGSPA